ncbi:ATP-binding protein [Streptomyces noursei]|uniref:ATP-binding protein n=1 Tax=Streptomyces noursei TaxID=1971 RepID=UPI0023B7F5A0|nr:ATP-binding protein [Streptomyces noursei]
MTAVDERPPQQTRHPARESYRFSVPSSPTAPRVAREMAANLLTLTGHGAVAETVRLLVSELVTNAYAHTHSRVIHLDVSVRPDRVTVAVWDTNPELRPQMRATHADEESGRGLRLVDQLATSWGVVWPNDPPARWKRVWFALAESATEAPTVLMPTDPRRYQ